MAWLWDFIRSIRSKRPEGIPAAPIVYPPVIQPKPCLLEHAGAYPPCGDDFQKAAGNGFHFLQPVDVVPLTRKEQPFLKARGLTAEWKRVKGDYPIAQWLYANLNPEPEFENLVAALLRHQFDADVATTVKIDDKDGGFDGIGTCPIGNEHHPVGVQVKLYNPQNSYVDDTECDQFAGALLKRGLRHGFFLTTGRFTPRFRTSIGQFLQNGMHIHAWDRANLHKIFTAREPGFGLKQTEIGLHYLNENFLREQARPNDDFPPRNGFAGGFRPDEHQSPRFQPI